LAPPAFGIASDSSFFVKAPVGLFADVSRAVAASSGAFGVPSAVSADGTGVAGGAGGGVVEVDAAVGAAEAAARG